ncbi:hypothetical protein NPIL_582511, partial [Nephila pilipes]
GVKIINNLNDHITQHVRNITPEALHSTTEHVIDHLDCILLHNEHEKPELDRHRHAYPDTLANIRV